MAALRAPLVIRRCQTLYLQAAGTVVAEAATNVATHICVHALDEQPDSYADSFFLLGERGIIGRSLAVKLGQLAGFGNLLVPIVTP